MLKHSPAESLHALDVDAISSASSLFWSAIVNGSVVECGALKHLDNTHAELKSMKASDAFVGHGVGQALLTHLFLEAKGCGYKRLSLETGTMPIFITARSLHESMWFVHCAPFDGYFYDPNSVSESLEI